MSDSTITCDQCGKVLSITPYLNSDLRLICDDLAYKLTRAEAELLRLCDERGLTQVKTTFGTFGISRRATWGFSVVKATRACTHHRKRLAIGDLTIVEHRRKPLFRTHVGMGWCTHVATYDLEGVEIPLRTIGGE